MLIPKTDPYPKGEIPMTTITVQNNDHTMKHIMFIILGALTVMCLALGTGYLQP
jgi:heme O synthase-like polyprenyltransferase